MAQPTNLLQGPEPVETAELHFKLHCRLKVFETSTKYEEGHCCILAVSQYYGLIFVGNLNGFSVISTKSLTAGISPDEYPKRNIVLNLKPTHISVDVSQRILAVVCNSKPGSVLIFYNIQSFASKDVTPFRLTPISKLIQNSTAQVVDLTWQPNADASFVLCLSDGSVLALPQGTKDDNKFSLPSTTQATCFCWSPKGKQIVVGTATGTLSQYKPDLKLVKTLPCPPLFNGAAMVVSVLWISSFQFAVAYNDRANPESFPVITIVNAAKNEPVTVINYDDVTYSTTLFRNHQIYMSHQSPWNLILVSSANSIEVAVLHLKDGSSWEQWLLGDASRAELPLNPDRQETFPLGWAVDFTSQETIPWGEGTLAPMPRLLLVSDEGLLCVFNVVNASESAPQLCTPAKEPLDISQFAVSAKPLPPTTSELTSPPQGTKGVLSSPTVFGNGKPTFAFQSSSGFTAFPDKPQSRDGPINLQQQPDHSQLQIQQPQPPVQVPTQQQQSLPQIQQSQSLSTPSNTPFKLSTSNFGTAPTFSFGTAPNTSFAASSFATTSFTPTPPPPTGTTFALQPSSSQKELFSGKVVPQSTVGKQQVDAAGGTGSVPAPKKAEEPEVVGRKEEPSEKGENLGPGTPEMSAVDDSVYLSAVEEEVKHFNSELQQLCGRVRSLEVQVGTEEEKSRMKERMESLYKFWKEVKETTEGQSSEVHGVVMELMEAFAWLEDAKSRNLQRKNPSYIELKKSEELDPLNARHMSEISQLKYYIENQLKQLTGYLEKEWTAHQEKYRNEVKNRMAVPPLEEVYKTMHYQLKILQKQKMLVEELKGKMSQKKQKSKCQSLIISAADPILNDANGNRASELSKLAQNLLQLKINREDELPQSGTWEVIKSQLAAITDRSKKLTREKQTALRDVLNERDMVKIRPVKTSLDSSSFLRSLHLNKPASRTPKSTPPNIPSADHRQKAAPAVPTTQIGPTSVPEVPTERKYESQVGKPKGEEKVDAGENAGSPVEKGRIAVSVGSLGKSDERSPLASLLGIVSGIGKKTDNSTFVFGSPAFQKAELSKDTFTFASPKSDQKQLQPKTSHPFTFGTPKPPESIFNTKDTATNSDAIKPPTAINFTNTTTTTTTPFSFTATISAPPPPPSSSTCSSSSSSSSSFTFTPSTPSLNPSIPQPSSSSTPLPKINFLFTQKDSAPTAPTSAQPPTTTLTSPFPASTPIFSLSKTTTTTTATTSTPRPPSTKLSTDTPSTGFTFTLSDNKTPPTTITPAPSPAPAPTPAPIKPTSETEDVDVLTIDDPPNKPQPPPDTSTPTAPTSSTDPSPPPKPSTLAPSTAPPSSTSSVFSFSSVSAPNTTLFFPQTTAITTTTTTTTTTTSTTTATTPSFFGTPTTTSSLFSQVSSTTPTASIFGGSTSSSAAPNIFGGSTPANPPSETSPPSTTSENIFGSPSSTTNSFSQVSTPSAPFAQKTNTVDATANLFGQLLSDGNKTVFGGSSPAASTTASNIFTSPKSIFEPPSTTTQSLFGSSFGSSVFGQSTTASSIFGQPQTSTSNSFFSQSTFNAFGKTTSATPTQTLFKSTAFAEPVFGQSVFGQNFKGTTNATTFPSSSTSIFGGTPTTTAPFGSTSPGPFSGGTTTFGESAFGSSTATFQKPLGGFASPSVFGGAPAAPAFGGSPTFGGSPSFGSLPTFGSVSQGTFGQTAGSATFESFANQNTVGFGNLAQQSQEQTFGSGFGSPSFESKPAFGGNSFSSWRSK